jgi:ParB family chromosome partitioning protein
MSREAIRAVEMVPIDRISVINPRVRNKKVFREIVDNIAELGLKKPITVARRQGPDGPRYDLVCGQGRLEAFKSLGQKEIPALVVDAENEECLVMSLVENLARRQHRAIDLLHDIEGLKRRGYAEDEIAQKTALSPEYVHGVIKLLEQGEHRLLRAVEAGHIPVTVAVDIATTEDSQVQAALQQAYENKLLRGRRLTLAKRLIEQRRRRGKGLRNGTRAESGTLSSAALIRAYREEADKQRLLVKKAEACRERLIFIVQALRALFAEDGFVNLLRAEGLDTVPKRLAERMECGE